MESILTTFGIDWRLLLINMVNFGLLVLGLWYFLYGPVMKMLEDRRQKLHRGVEDAEKATVALQEIEGTRAQKLAEAAGEADEMLARARAAAAAKEKELRDAAERSVESLLSDAELQAKETKARAIAESREEVAKLIVLGMEKALTK
ncbi:MAG: atpF [Candidatus Adlerbacteria bacterium]|nr:atpF [Candidatus Adlerbacteria bacterium]